VILKIKDGGDGHLKKSKNRNISALDRPVLKKFGMLMCLDSRSSQPRQHIKLNAFKNSTWLPIAIWKI